MNDSRRRLFVAATAFAGTGAAGFSGFYGGRAHQMLVDFGDGADWFGVLTYVDAAMLLLAFAVALGAVFAWLIWSGPCVGKR